MKHALNDTFVWTFGILIPFAIAAAMVWQIW
jgi:hypothetical protein